MQQILQSLKDGKTELVQLPYPKLTSMTLISKTSCSLISSGTERMLIDFGKSSLIAKAKKQPEKVKAVVEKIKTDGLLTTIDAVKSKLEQTIAMGYSNVGTVLEVASDISEFVPGDRIVSNGPHAEVVRVAKNLCAKVPESVSDEQAAFTVPAAIALQGIRLIEPTLAETVVVSGLGLIGLLAVQLLKANGCNVIGLDFDKSRLELAKSFGANVVDLGGGNDPVAQVLQLNNGLEVDAVLIAASTSSSEPVHQAACMTRKRGRIVLVGVTGLELMRSDFYEKELSFQVSCSYGPGRYEPGYEEEGHDYPQGFVRWTEQRNFEAVLQLMSDGKVDTDSLISHVFDFNNSIAAYDVLTESKSALAVMLNYSSQEDASIADRTIKMRANKDINSTNDTEEVVVGVIGAGNYAGRILLPHLAKTKARLHTLATSLGMSGHNYGNKFNFNFSTTDTESLLQSTDINTVVVATRHNSHAKFVLQALENNKHVFVEKPLCLTLDELESIVDSYNKADGRLKLMVGFNRRFSPLVQEMKTLLLSCSSPKVFSMTVNAGFIPNDHWTQSFQIGGGRILGEACHFVDLLRFLAGYQITGSDITYMSANGKPVTDVATIKLEFSDGSIGTIHYLANGHKAVPKERLEVFCDNKVLQLNNFRELKGYGWNIRRKKLFRQDKGQKACITRFIDSILTNSLCPIGIDEIEENSRVMLNLASSINVSE